MEPLNVSVAARERAAASAGAPPPPQPLTARTVSKSVLFDTNASGSEDEDGGGSPAAGSSATEEDGEYGSPVVRTATSRTFASVATSSAMWKSPAHTVILLDWDDTLFPTTWLQGRRWFRGWVAGGEGLSEVEKASKEADMGQLAELDKLVRSFVVAASNVGQVCCVTLARRPWQDRTMRAFFPCLSEAWEELDVQVRYAREEKSVEAHTRVQAMVRNADPEDDLELMLREDGKRVRQKMKAMQRLIRQFYQEGSWKNVVSIGDGPFERQALMELSLKHVNPVSMKSGVQKEFRVKTVQMVMNPSCDTLCEELQTLTSWLPSLVCVDNDVDVNLNASEDELFNLQAHISDLLEPNG